MIRLFNDAHSVNRAAADRFAQNAREAVGPHGQFNVALPGGHTPRSICRLLAQPPWCDQIPWRDIRVFWGTSVA